jgi:hypothetical protein
MSLQKMLDFDTRRRQFAGLCQAWGPKNTMERALVDDALFFRGGIVALEWVLATPGLNRGGTSWMS